MVRLTRSPVGMTSTPSVSCGVPLLRPKRLTAVAVTPAVVLPSLEVTAGFSPVTVSVLAVAPVPSQPSRSPSCTVTVCPLSIHPVPL